MNDAIYNLMCVAIGWSCGAMMWRGNLLEAKTNARMLERYRSAVSQLNIWCGHESPHARLIAAHISAIGEGNLPMNAGTPCGDEVCDIDGTRMQLRQLDVNLAGNGALMTEISDIATALGTTRFIDPPDGGSINLSDQVRRMREELECLEALVSDTEWLKAELAVRMEREEQQSTYHNQAMRNG